MATAVSAPTLNTIFKIDPIAQEQSDQFWQSAWKVAQYASIAFFIIASTGGFVFTSVFYPSQVFGVILAIYTLGLYYATQFASYLYNKSASYGNSAIAQGKLVKQLNLIKDEEVPNLVQQLGVNPPAEISQNELKLGLARYLRLKDDQVKLLEKRRKLHEKYPAINAPLAVGNLDWKDREALISFAKSLQKRIKSRDLENQAALTNVMAAHTLMLLHSPFENRPLGEFCQFIPFQVDALLISKAHGDLSTDVFMKAKLRQFTAGEILKKDAPTLAREIFELPPSQSASRWSFRPWKSS